MKTPVHLLAALSLATVSTLGATGCVIRETRGAYTTRATVHTSASVVVGNPGYVYVQTLPPDPLYETISPAPSYGYVWIDGYWHWSGYEWIWVPGHWEAPRDGYVYIEPYYDYSDGYYVYNPGYWEHGTRVPSTVVVREHGDGRPPTGYHPNRPARVTVTTTPAGGSNTVVVHPTNPNGGGNVIVHPTQPSGGGTVTVQPTNPDRDTIVVRPTQPGGGSGGNTVIVTEPPKRNPHLDEGINQNPDGPVRMPDRDHSKPAVVQPDRGGTVIVTPNRTTTTPPAADPPPREVRPIRVNTNQDPPPRQVNPTTGGGVRVNPTPTRAGRPTDLAIAAYAPANCSQ